MRIEVHEFVFPTLGGALYGSAVTDTSGGYRIVGIPVSGNLSIEFPEQSLYNGSGQGRFISCGDRVTNVGDYIVVRAVTGLNVSDVAPARPGPFTIGWDPVPAAAGYCVALWQDQTALYQSTCLGFQSSVKVTTASFTTPPLTAGLRYTLRVDALGPNAETDGIFLGQLRYGAVWFDVR